MESEVRNTETTEQDSKRKLKRKRSRTPDTTEADTSKPTLKGVEEDETNCPVCLEQYEDGDEVKTLKCGHRFHEVCADRSIKMNNKCPICRIVITTLQGNQPSNGSMMTRKIKFRLPGYDCDTISITYFIPFGIQDETHPAPGVPYSSLFRVAYLPDNEEGKKLLELFRKAFAARLTFTVGTSLTTGYSNVLVWNDIHHKTSTVPGSVYGYPDPTYFARVTADIHALGIE